MSVFVRALSTGAAAGAGDCGGAGAIATNAHIHRVWQPDRARRPQALLLRPGQQQQGPVPAHH